MASLASTTVFIDDRTRMGTGRYCSAARAMAVVVGVGGMMMDSSLWTEPGEGGSLSMRSK